MLYLDAASSFWREWVISYDSAHQSVLGQEAMSGSRRLWQRSREWTRSRYVSMLDWLRQRQGQVEHSPGRWGGLVLGILALFAVLGNAGRISRRIRAWHLRAHPEQSPELAATMWYLRMARSLARRGLRKSTAQTPEEFIRVIGDEPLRQRVAQFTAAYESARFGNSTDDARRLSELYEEVESETQR
jgi:hypothetical protein